MKKPDLITPIAIWEFIAALGALVVISALAIFAFPQVSILPAPAATGGLFGLSIAVLVFLCYGGISVAGGIGLFYGKEWGRSLSIVHAILTAFCVPIGTIIGILILVYLMRPRVKEYFEIESD